MDTNVIRQKYIDMLYGQIDQTQWLEFKSNPEYRVRSNLTTVSLLESLADMEDITDYEYRWLRDTWLY